MTARPGDQQPGGHSSTTPIGALIERAGAAVVVTLPEGVIMSWNAAAGALYGYTASEVIGRQMSQLVPADQRSEHDELRRRALAGEHVRDARVVRRHLDGSLVDAAIELYHVPAAQLPERLGGAGGATHTSLSAAAVDALARHLAGIVFVADTDGRITLSTGGGLALLGIGPGDAVGLNIRDFVHNPLETSMADDVIGGGEFDGPIAVGETMWRLSCGPITEGDTRVGILGVAMPTDEEWTEASSAAARQARFRALVEHTSDIVCVVDARMVCTYMSPSIERQLGWTPEQIVGRSVLDFVDHESMDGLGSLLRDLRDGRPPPIQGTGLSLTFPARTRRADGTWCEYEFITTDYLDDPAVGGFVVNGRDITERQQAAERLRHASLHDALTDLPNRALLIEQIDGTLDHTTHPRRIGVVVIGVDSFKLVNDSLGHGEGDQLLQALAGRLRAQACAGDTVARLGGDTFAVTTTGVSDVDGARALAVRLLEVVAEPYELGGRRIAVTACAGVALSGSGEDGTTLARNADTAMYAAKRRGRGQVEVFEARLRSEATRQLTLEQSLGRAVAGDELRVHFQPIMKLTARSGPAMVSGVEALVRWQHHELGMVPPFDFIPLSEETGHIVEIGAWVLHESCRTLIGWGGAGGPLRLSVNLSPRQLLEPDLPDVVAGILDGTGFPPERLTMEVTESVLVDEGPYATETLRRLREMGVHLSIDDFGTGYSSLVYLRRLNADALKIDRSFVDGLGRDSEADAIVHTVIGLARSLGLDLVAEGVETDEQRRLLVDLGCQFAQGYLFSPPVPAPGFEAWRSAADGLGRIERA